MEQMKDICDVDDLFDRMRRQFHEIRMAEAHKVLVTRGYRPDRQKGVHRQYIDANGGVVTVRDENPLKALYLKGIASRIEGGAKP